MTDEVGFRLQSWDIAGSTGKGADYSAGTAWEVRGDGFHLVDLWRGRLEFPALKRKVTEWAERFMPQALLVENKAGGMALLQELRAVTHLPLIAVNPVEDKVTRMMRVTPLFEAGRVFFPRHAPWLGELEAELLAFPHAGHDDQADSVSQALGWLQGRQRAGNAGVRGV